MSFSFHTMFFVQFGLLAVIANMVQGAPQGSPTDIIPYQHPEADNPYPLKSKPTSYDTIQPTPYPYSDPYNPNADYFTVIPPGKANGMGFFLILESANNHYGGGPDGQKELNVVMGFFDDINETAKDGLEFIIRQIQSVVEPNENFHDGRFETLLDSLGLVKVRRLRVFKNSLQADENKEVK